MRVFHHPDAHLRHRRLLILPFVMAFGGVAQALFAAESPSLGSLKTVSVPEPSNLGEFVRDRQAAIQLGKALFWDQQLGSDGVQSCASCHFHAGGDNRRKNQLNPGLNAGDKTFQLGGPNYTLRAKDFPVMTNDVVSSQGVFNTGFVDVVAGQAVDTCGHIADDVFHVGGINTRRPAARNAPTMINAVFNFRNFWDGRAQNRFNGENPFGSRDSQAGVWRTQDGVSVEKVSVSLENASLASQAAGPPLSDFEMSCAGRYFAAIGKKMLDPAMTPLAKQEVHPEDSALGPVARTSGGSRGLTVSYKSLVEKAFQPQWWNSSSSVTVGGRSYSQAEANFALFFSLAVQLYEATLVADDSRMDQYFEGKTAALTDLEKQGLAVFTGKGKCVACHAGPETTRASVSNVRNERLERMIMGDGGCAIYDTGFYNIGVRPTAEDLGVGGTDPFGNPLSDTRMAMAGRFTDPNLSPSLGERPECDTRAAVDGAFKTPGLRNIELTGPFFHNGGKGTLRQVVEFYNRGGDFASENIANLDADIHPLGLSDGEIQAVVAFLQAMTDERVRQESGPFDHPQLFRPQGHPGNMHQVAVKTTGPAAGVEAQDDLFEVGATGAGGRPAEGLLPLTPFLTVTQMTGSGTFGSGDEHASFDFKFREKNETNEGVVKVSDKARKLKISATSVDEAFPTENCVQLTGSARVNGDSGYYYVAKGCDHGQFKRKDGSGSYLRRDTFGITVTDATGAVVYSRGERLSGGNLTAHIK